MSSFDQRLQKLENTVFQRHSNLGNVFPMKSINDFQNLEQRVQDNEAYANEMVCYFIKFVAKQYY